MPRWNAWRRPAVSVRAAQQALERYDTSRLEVVLSSPRPASGFIARVGKPLLFAAVFAGAGPTIATAQGLRQAPKPVAGRALTIWQEEGPVRPDVGLRPVRVLARNDTTVPVAITTLRLSKCKNFRLACEPLQLERTVLPPRGFRPILEVFPVDGGKRHSFDAEADWRVATECMGRESDATSATTGVSQRKVNSRSMVLPPEYPSSLRGVRFEVDFFLNGAGNVDSVQVDGIPDPKYLAKLRNVMAAYQFTVELLDGCPEPAKARLQMQLGN